MNLRLRAAAAALMAVSLVSTYAHASDATPPAKKSKKAAKPKGPTVEEQIQALRQEMQGQIDSLKNSLADKDTQLKQAQQSATDAQAAAVRAQQAADAQNQAVTQNAAAVGTLQSTVTDLKANQVSIVTTMSDEHTAIKKSIANPDQINFKGVGLSFTGSFLAAETVWRQGATGGDVNTPFTAIPLDHSNNAQMSEFFGSGRQSRLAFRATGKLSNVSMSGYYEMDWLSAGVTSNDNQSNSYTLRQRQLWADAKFTNGWDISGGQGWSLATETTQGLTRGTEILPQVIDAQYVTGFVWSRQYSFRVSKALTKKFFAGIAVENPETLNPAGSSLPTNLLIGSAGTGGGLYNLNANYSFNYAPDMIAKMAFEPGWGHWELFGIGRSWRARIYPNEVCITNPITGALGCSNATNAYNDVTFSGGVGGGFRGPLLNKKLSIGLKGLWGQGMGRYGSSTIADVTLRPTAQIAPLHGFSALSTVEINPNPRLSIYVNYGGDYIDRRYFGKIGYGSPLTNMSGCNTEPVPGLGPTNGGVGFTPSTPSNCGNQNKDVQEFTAGYWYNFYSGPKGRMRMGLQYAWFERDLWSGAGGPNNPGGGAKGTDNMFFTSMRYYLP